MILLVGVCLDCGDETVLRCVLCGTGGYQQSGVHPPLGMNSFQVQGDERESQFVFEFVAVVGGDVVIDMRHVDWL